MNSYKYTALASGGREVTGLIEAIDELEATAKIRNQYNAVISIKEVKGVAGIKLPKFLTVDFGSNKLNNKEFTLMCSQFATILSAGIPIARAVKLIEDKTTDKFLKKLLIAVGDDVEAGRTLSASFEDHGGSVLPPTFCETIKAGEEAGDLSGAFESVYKHFDKQTKMGAKVKGALTYPAFVFVVAIAVVIILMVKVVPSFTSMFDEMGGELPFITQLLIGMSDFVRKTFIYFIIIMIILFIAYIMYKRTPKGAINLAKIQLKLPVLGNIAELNSASLFANTMATMIQSGLPMTKAVDITSKVMPNALIAEQTHNMVTRIEEGRTVVDSMREADCFPDILTDMVGVGEETGEMKATLDTVARYYDNELEQAVASAIAMLEPAVLVFLAGFAGFIVIAIYMAMFSMYSYM